jgi:hypothetical protein
MNETNLKKIETYSRKNPDKRALLMSKIDAFAHVGDEITDMFLLRRIFKRMKEKPAIASCICSLGAGYEHIAAADKPELDDIINRMIRAFVAGRADGFARVIERVETPEVMNPDIQRLMDVSILERDACVEAGNRFDKYKCNIRTDPHSQSCGVNTNYLCVSGGAAGSDLCERRGGRCALTEDGKKNVFRKEGKKFTTTETMAARTAYRARNS